MPKILLVEDNELNREMLSRRLVRNGFEVLIAVDGLQGVAMASAQSPDLVLMDMSLPGIDGWEATRRLKADAATRAVPVIALTAHAMSEDRAKALAAGCDDFDTKPIDLDRLLGKIHTLLQPAPPQPLWASDLTMPALAQSLPAFKTALDDLCHHAGIQPDLRDDLQVVLDEVCANIVQHAYPSGAPGAVRLLLRHWPALPALASGPEPRPAALEVTVIDQGKPFNPLTQPAPDVSQPVEERLLGGLGIHFVRQMTDSQRYSHSVAEGNRLTLVKHLG